MTVLKHLDRSVWQQATLGFRRGLGEEQDMVTNSETKHHVKQNGWAGSQGDCALEPRAGCDGVGAPEGWTPVFLAKATKKRLQYSSEG